MQLEKTSELETRYNSSTDSTGNNVKVNSLIQRKKCEDPFELFVYCDYQQWSVCSSSSLSARLSMFV